MLILEVCERRPTLPDYEPKLVPVSQQYFCDFERAKAAHIAGQLMLHFDNECKPYVVRIITMKEGVING